jgi:hypothetical protein
MADFDKFVRKDTKPFLFCFPWCVLRVPSWMIFGLIEKRMPCQITLTRHPDKKLYLPGLNVQIFHIQSVVFNKLPTRLNLIAHQDGKDLIGFDRIFDIDLQ